MDNISSKISTAHDTLYDFFVSNQKCMLVKRTACYEKHKIIMCALNEVMSGGHFLFRSEGLSVLPSHDVLGWIGIEKAPSSGQKMKIDNNTYKFDSMFNPQTKQ